MTTDCPNGEIRDMLPDLVNGTLEGESATRIEEHVRGCEDCRLEYELIVSVRTALTAAAPEIDAGPIVLALPGYRAQPRWGGRYTRAAAGIALLAGGLTVAGAMNGWLPRGVLGGPGDAAAVSSGGTGAGTPPGPVRADLEVALLDAADRFDVALEVRLQTSEVDLTDDAFAALIAEIENTDAVLIAEPQRRQVPIGSAVPIDLPDSVIFRFDPGEGNR